MLKEKRKIVKMNKEVIKSRIDDLKKAIDNSLGNHNALLGRMAEAEYLLSEIEKVAEVATEVIDVVK